jgi:VIT1/CCC1 family predicted Fe2+/Mn2+ transporter
MRAGIVAARVLDPLERASEILFGVIMVLTFTGSISVAEGGAAETRELLIGAIACNLAWGIVDGVMYVLATLTERARARMTGRRPIAPEGVLFRAGDLVGASAVFLLVFLSTFPIVVPFLVMRDTARALRTSNAIAVAMLFAVGWRLGTYAGVSGLRIGLTMVAIGLVLVAITMALGG